MPLGDNEHLVRITASTHDQYANIRKNDPEAMANTHRLQEKFLNNMEDFTLYDYDTQKGSERLLLTWGITADAARDAVKLWRDQGNKVDLLVLKSLLPVSEEIYKIIDKYPTTIIAEENLNGQLKEILFGQRPVKGIKQVNKMGNMITPNEILEGLNQ